MADDADPNNRPADPVTDDTGYQVLLSQGMVAWIDAEDAPLLGDRKWFALRNGGLWYATRQEQAHGIRRRLHLHRLILGDRPGFMIDHKDGDGLNCRRSNLRHVTCAQNCANRSAAGGKGVSATRHGTFKVTIQGRHMGTYRTRDDALRIYDLSALVYFGEYARLNFAGEALAA